LGGGLANRYGVVQAGNVKTATLQFNVAKKAATITAFRQT
jgi:hypothetical protein